jgi:hypothetical protein
MSADLTDPFGPSCCDGGSTTIGTQSCQPCGCDLGINYIKKGCWIHDPVMVFGSHDKQAEIPKDMQDHMQKEKEQFMLLKKQEFEEIERRRRDIETKLNSVPTYKTAQWRKERPVYSGVLAYFPDALLEVAYVSFKGNEQHNPGQPLHWAREKSTDQLDCAVRHLIDHAKDVTDDGGMGLHLAKTAWRALAELQLFLERQKPSTS